MHWNIWLHDLLVFGFWFLSLFTTYSRWYPLLVSKGTQWKTIGQFSMHWSRSSFLLPMPGLFNTSIIIYHYIYIYTYVRIYIDIIYIYMCVSSCIYRHAGWSPEDHRGASVVRVVDLSGHHGDLKKDDKNTAFENTLKFGICSPWCAWGSSSFGPQAKLYLFWRGSFWLWERFGAYHSRCLLAGLTSVSCWHLKMFQAEILITELNLYFWASVLMGCYCMKKLRTVCNMIYLPMRGVAWHDTFIMAW